MDKATQVLRLMVEGMSIRGIERITGVHRDTILRLLLLAAEKINAKLRHTFENLEIARIQFDEFIATSRNGSVVCPLRNPTKLANNMFLSAWMQTRNWFFLGWWQAHHGEHNSIHARSILAHSLGFVAATDDRRMGTV